MSSSPGNKPDPPFPCSAPSLSLSLSPPVARALREHLEGLKIQGLTFRLMPEEILIRTLSFGSEEDEWLNVCKDWLEALSPSTSALTDDGADADDEAEQGSPHE